MTAGEGHKEHITASIPRIKRKEQLGPHHCTNWLLQCIQLIMQCIPWLTLSNITSISEYFIPWTRIGTSLVRCGDNASLQIGWSANDSQNSQASKATLSSGSWVRINMYWSKYTPTKSNDVMKTLMNITDIFVDQYLFGTISFSCTNQNFNGSVVKNQLSGWKLNLRLE